MPRLAPFAALIVLASPLASAPLNAAPGGQLGTLPLGRYVCELPGDATASVGVAQPGFDFTVTNGSSYKTATGKGIYLLTGDRVTFTSGPHDGLTYRRITSGFLRRTNPDGKDSTLRCVKGSRLTVTGSTRPDTMLEPALPATPDTMPDQTPPATSPAP